MKGADYHRSAQQLSGGVGAGGARPRRQNVQRGQRQLAAVCRQPAAERGGVRERQRHRHPVSGQALCPAEWR